MRGGSVGEANALKAKILVMKDTQGRLTTRKKVPAFALGRRWLEAFACMLAWCASRQAIWERAKWPAVLNAVDYRESRALKLLVPTFIATRTPASGKAMPNACLLASKTKGLQAAA